MSRSRTTVLIALGLAAWAAPARAEAEEWAVSLGPAIVGLTEAPSSGEDGVFRPAWGLAARARYGLDDFWQAGMSVDLGLATPEVAFIGGAQLELSYVVDIVTWVPYVTLGVGVLARDAVPSPSGAEGPLLDLVVGLGGGLEYRPDRDWALFFSGRYMLVATDLERVSGAFQTALGVTLFFE